MEGTSTLGPDVWSGLLLSVARRRNRDARFFKPVLLVAAIDSVLSGKLDPTDLDLGVLEAEFDNHVQTLCPDRVGLAWRPFWHLSNDGAWVFSKAGSRVEPAAFGKARKPDSKGQLSARYDAAAVPEGMRRYWLSGAHLMMLREHLVNMLASDDSTCRQFALHLHGSGASPAAVDFSSSRPLQAGQGFLDSPEARRAVERRAMIVAYEALTAEGWELKDLSKTESFDYFATRGSEQVLVEVKGTTTDASHIMVTAKECELALSNVVILAVVSRIEISLPEGGEARATGGELRVFNAWKPEEDRMQPISFRYRLRP